MTTRIRLAALATSVVLGWALAGPAQGPGKKDGDLDDLLKKVEDASKPKPADPAKSDKPGGVAPKDKDLDDFLDKLGEEKDKPAPDLGLARHTIDMLGVLHEKTRGNLSLEEQRLLENSLTELRFRFVQVSDEVAKAATQKA